MAESPGYTANEWATIYENAGVPGLIIILLDESIY
jgi:hypothetical protein